jgi:oxygen-independent coproporphyrinogen III oxidase
LSVALGIYISVPFCRTKCSYCNFASDVFSKAVFGRYVDRLCADVESMPETAAEMGGQLGRLVDSIYFGGGTPTVLDSSHVDRIFSALRQQFEIPSPAEITFECAPGTLSDEVMAALLRSGVNRISLGVQSFVDQEAAAVGRLHKRETVLQDISRLRRAGISNINIDLIAGLPHQTAESWEFSLKATIAAGVPHVSVYMLEVDEDSRLGTELLAGGTRYHAHFVPNEDAIADFYGAACEHLERAGIAQYEISNFARGGLESGHNLKYWTRQPYLGCGVDAHSMLCSAAAEVDAVRFSFPDSLERYLAGARPRRIVIPPRAALEENFFLGLRLTRGVNLVELAGKFGDQAVENVRLTIAQSIEDGMMEQRAQFVRLTSRGRLLSNEVFERFIIGDEVVS